MKIVKCVNGLLLAFSALPSELVQLRAELLNAVSQDAEFGGSVATVAKVLVYRRVSDSMAFAVKDDAGKVGGVRFSTLPAVYVMPVPESVEDYLLEPVQPGEWQSSVSSFREIESLMFNQDEVIETREAADFTMYPRERPIDASRRFAERWGYSRGYVESDSIHGYRPGRKAKKPSTASSCAPGEQIRFDDDALIGVSGAPGATFRSPRNESAYEASRRHSPYVQSLLISPEAVSLLKCFMDSNWVDAKTQQRKAALTKKALAEKAKELVLRRDSQFDSKLLSLECEIETLSYRVWEYQSLLSETALMYSNASVGDYSLSECHLECQRLLTETQALLHEAKAARVSMLKLVRDAVKELADADKAAKDAERKKRDYAKAKELEVNESIREARRERERIKKARQRKAAKLNVPSVPAPTNTDLQSSETPEVFGLTERELLAGSLS